MGEAERKPGGEGRKSGAGGKRRLSLAASCKRSGGAGTEHALSRAPRRAPSPACKKKPIGSPQPAALSRAALGVHELWRGVGFGEGGGKARGC